jgi:predicted esterase
MRVDTFTGRLTKSIVSCDRQLVGGDTIENHRGPRGHPWELSITRTKSQWIPLLGRCSLITSLLVLLFFQPGCRKTEPPREVRKGAFVSIFGGPSRTPGHISPYVAYNLVPENERYFVYVPSSYTGADPYGMIVFTYADPMARLPFGWQATLDARKYIFVAAQNAGNDQPRSRRLGLAVLGALKATKIYRIDPNRVYAAGFSGGARMAGLLGFYQSDIFRGTLQNSGADFYRPVPVVEAASLVDTAGHPYGLFQASDEDVRQAKAVRFVFITGSNDFRRGNILDIFHGGFELDGFKAKLFDVPGMGHDICDGQTLSRALDFLEGGS